MSSQLQKKTIIVILASVIFYVSLALFSDAKELVNNLQTIQIEFLPLILMTVLIGLTIRGIRQYLLLKTIGIEISMKENLHLYFIGLSMLITPGGSGELIKSYFLKKTHGFNISKTFPVVLTERFHDFVGVISLIGITLLFYDTVVSKVLFVLGVGLASVVFFIVRRKKLLEFIREKITKIKIINKITSNLPESNDSIIQLANFSTTLKAWLLSFAAILMESFAVYLCFIAMGVQFDYFLSSQIVFSSGLIGLLTLLPGGLGVTEGGIIALLVSNGINLATASALVLLIRLVTLWFATIVGFVSIRYNKV